MSTGVLGPYLLGYGFALWLGLYLLARNASKPALRSTGLGLIAYAASLAAGLLSRFAPDPSSEIALTRLGWLLSFLPALFWSGTLVWLLPDESPLRVRLARLWTYGLLSAFAALWLAAALGGWVIDTTSGAPQTGPGYAIFAAIVLAPLLASFLVVLQAYRSVQSGVPLGIILAATLFFGLGSGLLVFPLDWLPRDWMVLAIGLDLAVLGLAVAVLDAFEEGETLLPDAARSFAASFFIVLLFAGQVALAMALGEGLTFTLLALLLAISAAAIATQTLSDAIQTLFDRVVFARFGRLRQARSTLRAASSALPRVDETVDPAALDEDEFTRLTRRAISHLGDLSRLASSPLTRMTLVQDRLAARGAHDDAIERANELKALLSESIARLKPRGKSYFGTTDEWRHYNALHFPYVVGLKPYSRRADHGDLDPVARQALDWFRASVPERTLHNWQNVAARLIARELRERGQA